MSSIEVVTLLLLIPYLIWPFFTPKRPKWITFLPFPLLITLYLFGQGFRWQLIPAYLLLFICCAISLIDLIRGQKDNGRRWLSLIGSIVGLLWLALSFIIPIALPVPQFQAATGPYDLGTTTRHLKDDTRSETYTADPDDTRELMVQIWYPANLQANAGMAPYLDPLDVIAPIIAEQFGLPSFALNHLNLAQTDAYIDQPVAESAEPFPVIVFSHGLGAGLRGQNSNMVNELVSHGYVVAAIDHTYANAVTVFPDGRVITYDPTRLFPSGEANPVEGNPLVKVWAADIGFVLDELTTWNNTETNPFHGRLNLNQVGVFGHSTGGGATLEFCWQDGRCQAGAPLDSWVGPVSAGFEESPPDVPFLFVSSPDWLGPENKARAQELFTQLPNDSYELTLADTGHYDFTDLKLLSPFTPQLGLTGTIDPQTSLTIQNEYLLAFFDHYLKGESREILSRPSPYPELTMTTNK